VNGGGRSVAVFAHSAAEGQRAVCYVKHQLPHVSVHLFTAQTPLPETVASCERVVVAHRSTELCLKAWNSFWPNRVAFAVSIWTRTHGPRLLKLAPFLLPPFRVLIMNENGDFFRGTPALIWVHCLRRVRDCVHSGWHRTADLNRGSRVFLAALFARLRIEVKFRLRLSLTWTAYQICEAIFRVRLALGWVRRLIRDPVVLALQLVRGAAFFCLAELAHRSPWFARAAFCRMHGRQSLSVEVPYGTGQEVACFEYTHSHADWNELQRLAKTSTARWILIRQSGADDEIKHCLELFQDQRTFAVSRQAGYSPPRPPFFRAPVRQLRPGEACRVLAPVSEAILVDRVKLVALGIPRTSHPGTAWMMLFWKAAAAGFSCYSVGDGEIGMLPEWPVHESEFVTRALSEPHFLRLGPRQPDLSRGTISFMIGAGRPLRSKPRVLLVSPYLPYPLSHGGAVRIYNLCRALTDRVDFLLATFREKDDVTDYAKLHEVFREVWVVDRETPDKGCNGYPKQVLEYQSRSMRALLAELCHEKRPDIVQFEYTQLAPLRRAVPDVPAILVEHDVTFALYGQVARKCRTRAARQDYRSWLRFERHWLQAYDAVWTVSNQDLKTAVSIGSRLETTFVVANGVDTEWFVPDAQPAAEPEILFVGSFRHFPNVVAFEKLLNEIMPRVWRHNAAARLQVIAGSDPEKHWSRFMGRRRPLDFDARIRVDGFVEDLRPFYRRAGVVVAPLAVSAGTNIKVLEAMACGKALVTSSVGCQGLNLRDGHEALIRDDWDEFAEAVARALTDESLARNLGAEARRTAESRFDWRRIADSAYDSYARVAALDCARHSAGSEILRARNVMLAANPGCGIE
jgi:polysaccharide biosynthesis protein PslH